MTTIGPNVRLIIELRRSDHWTETNIATTNLVVPIAPDDRAEDIAERVAREAGHAITGLVGAPVAAARIAEAFAEAKEPTA